MFNIDRHIAIQAGWIAGPAFGVAMMAAPNYLKLEPPFSGLLFWGGIAVFLLTIVVVLVLSFHEEGKRKAVFGSILMMALGALIFCGGAAWYFWPARDGKPQTTSVAQLPSEPPAAPLPPIAKPEGKAAEKQDKRAEILSKLQNKYPQRIIVDVTPKFLMNLYKDKLTIEGDRAIVPYIGNWLLLSGPLDDVSGRTVMFGTEVTFERELGEPFIHMYFDDLWIKRLHVLTPKQNIFVLCQLTTAGSATAMFNHCEVIDQDSGLPFSVP